ncbi:hypothetical protein [Nitrosococcus halophilus]|uniref:hypothetical protein n=1 Tax=Nitrosococcus halophilus TaxID=133539 RepID=UPI0002EDF6D4|nr:hypothetical protein [Nitrosococcus halophilus]
MSAAAGVGHFDLGGSDARGQGSNCPEPGLPHLGTAALAAPELGLATLEPDILIDSSRLPGAFHGDPADRIIAATARDLGACLLTRDGKILEYAARGFLAAKAI